MKSALLSLFCAFLLWGCPGTPKDPTNSDDDPAEGAALFISLAGTVWVIDKNETRKKPARLNQFLAPESRLITGPNSKAILLLTNGTTLSAGEKTELKLETFEQNRFDPQGSKVRALQEEASLSNVLLNLKAGDLVVEVKKLKKKSNFEISTPLGVAGIRGTSFKLLALAESTTLSVLTGQVNFMTPDKKKFEVKANWEIFAPKKNKTDLKPLEEEAKKAIRKAIDNAREKADDIELSTLSERLAMEEGDKGKVPKGWTGQGSWVVEKDGTLFLNPNGKSKAENFKDDLWTAQAHDDFELSLEYKYQPGDQTAVIFRAQNKEQPSGYYRVPIGDNEEQGGLSRIVKPAEKASKGPGRWNQLFVSAKGQKIRIELNGRKVVDVEIRPHPRRSVNNLSSDDNKGIPRQDRSLKGWLAIANEGDPMRFRKLSITKFKDGMATTYVVPSAGNLEMIWVEPGTFTMGSPPTEKGRNENEAQHQVSLTKGFYLGKYEVTQSEYELILGGNPSKNRGENQPVERVSWGKGNTGPGAMGFCQKVTELEKAAGRLPEGWAYTLPTEAEWEYACRAGTTTAYWWGDEVNASLVNYNKSGWGKPVDVGQYPPNPWGFHDMHGNVWEWVADSLADYPAGPVTNPTGPTEGTGGGAIRRGGSFYWDENELRSAMRHSHSHHHFRWYLGFRLALKKIN